MLRGPIAAGFALVAAIVAVCGCQGSPSHSLQRNPSTTGNTQPEPTPDVVPSNPMAVRPATTPASPVAGPNDLAAVEAMVIHVDQTERLAPALRQKLFDDLCRAEPVYRAAMVQAFLADLAYRRQQQPQPPTAPYEAGPAAVASNPHNDNPLRGGVGSDWPARAADRPAVWPQGASPTDRQVSYDQPEGGRAARDIPATAGVRDVAAPRDVPSVRSAPLREIPITPPPRDGQDRTANNEQSIAAARDRVSGATPAAAPTPNDAPAATQTANALAANALAAQALATSALSTSALAPKATSGPVGSAQREVAAAAQMAAKTPLADPAWLRPQGPGESPSPTADNSKASAREETPAANKPSPASATAGVASAATRAGLPTSNPAASALPADASWQDHLAAAIKALEAEPQLAGRNDVDVELEARLRLLYLAAQRRDDALKKIASAQPSTQEFWSNELYGLAVWLDAKRVTDPSQRAAEARLHLSEAIARLNETAPLALRNLTFSPEVRLYGSYTVYQSFEFAPGQEVMLYVEVDNFKSDYVTGKGYYTSFQGRYAICDSTGHEVAAQKIAKIEEHCRVQRRDFFVTCKLAMPRRINPGKYTLKLTIEDNLAKKMAQESIGFAVRDAAP